MDKDISTLLQEIKAATSWSEPRMAAELSISQPTVNRILNGQQECKLATLRAIEAVHARTCAGRRKDDAPAAARPGPERRQDGQPPRSP
jgi:hypothetical protein